MDRSPLRVTVTGASGLIGRSLVTRLLAQGDQVTALSRDPERTGAALGVPALAWEPSCEAAPARGLAGQDAVIHLAGENIAQRWSARAKREIRESRVLGTRNLVEGLEGVAGERPRVLLSGSGIGYYGPHGEDPLDEESPAGLDFLARLCVEWESEAQRAGSLGIRVVRIRTGVLLDPLGGALAKLLPPFRAGLGGPVAGGRQFASWIHPDDLIGIILMALEEPDLVGPLNGTAPEPVTNRELARVLGRVLHRPAFLPVPALALRALYGEMSELITTGARVLPAKALVQGYSFRHPHLEAALASLLG